MSTPPPLPWWRLALLATALVTLMWVPSGEWALLGADQTDAMAYLGLFRFLDDPSWALFEYRQMRMPWLVTGWLFHSVLPVATATVLLTTLPVIAVATLGGLLAGRRSPSAALLATTMLATSPWLHQVDTGGAYHNAFAEAWFLGALLAACHARWRLAGAAMGLALLNNLVLLALLPCLWVRGPWRRGPRPVELLQGGALVLAGTVGLAAAMGRAPWFFLPLAERAVDFVLHPEHNIYVRGVDAIGQAGWLVPLLGAAGVALGGARSADEEPRAWSRLFLLGLLVWGAWQLQGQTALDWARFAYPLQPLAMLAVATTLADRMRFPVGSWLVGMVLGVLMAGSSAPLLALLALWAGASAWSGRTAWWTPALLGLATAASMPHWSLYAPRACQVRATDLAALVGAAERAHELLAGADSARLIIVEPLRSDLDCGTSARELSSALGMIGHLAPREGPMRAGEGRIFVLARSSELPGERVPLGPTLTLVVQSPGVAAQPE